MQSRDEHVPSTLNRIHSVILMKPKWTAIYVSEKLVGCMNPPANHSKNIFALILTVDSFEFLFLNRPLSFKILQGKKNQKPGTIVQH